jgi:hypothetical protein
MTLFGMTLVDAYLLAKGCGASLALQNIDYFVEQLATELINNDYDKRNLRKRKRSREVEAPTIAVNTSLYLTNPTPTKRLRKNKKTGKLTCCKQGRCTFCKEHWTTFVCRECQKDQHDPTKKQFWICKAGTQCFDRHIKYAHPEKVLPQHHA